MTKNAYEESAIPYVGNTILTNISDELSLFIQNSQLYIYPWLIFIGALWALNILNWIFGSRLNLLGIYPRRFWGLLGIPLSPFIHQNFSHLFFNSIPLFALGLILLARGLDKFYYVTGVVIFLGGFTVWLFGRKAIHIGASGVVSGYFGYLLATAYLSPSFTTLFVGALVLYYFGAILFGIFPQEDRVSWESHLFGFLSGLLCAILPMELWI